MRAIDRAEIIGSHDVFDDLKRHLDERLAHADAGVVDEDVDLTEISQNFGDHNTNLVKLADITSDGGG